MFLFSFLNSNIFRNEYEDNEGAQRKFKGLTSPCLKKTPVSFIISIMILTRRFLIMLVAIIQISVPIHREVSFHIHHINADIRRNLACCRQRSLVLESCNIKSEVT